MHHALHKVVKRMGGQTTKGRGARGVRGVHTFLIAKNAPNHENAVSLAKKLGGSCGNLPKQIVGVRSSLPTSFLLDPMH